MLGREIDPVHVLAVGADCGNHRRGELERHGAAIVGVVLAAVFLGDRFMGGPAIAFVVGAVLAGAFGVLASIAGSALPRRELEALEREIVSGKTLVTIDVESKPAAEALQPDLERCGALRTGILYGPGLGSSRIVRRRPGPVSC